MKKYIFPALLLMGGTIFSFNTHAQDQQEEKEVHESIILRKNGTFPNDLTIHIHGDKITINGKTPKDIDVIRRKSSDGEASSRSFRQFRGNKNPHFNFRSPSFGNSSKGRALLGVVTKRSDSTNGARIEEVEIGTAADSVGLKKGDIITQINDQSISSPQELSESIHSFNPGDKITVTYLRNKNEAKTTLVLGRISDHFNNGFGPSLGRNRAPDNNMMEQWFKRLHPGMDMGPNLRMRSGAGPKLGALVENHQDPKGTTIIKIEPNSAAEKAGLEKGDVITALGSKRVGSIRDLKEAIYKNKGKDSVKVSVRRGDKTVALHVSLKGAKERASL